LPLSHYFNSKAFCAVKNGGSWLINWNDLAGEERYRQGTMIVNEGDRVVLERIDSIGYDQYADMATVFFKKAVESREGG